MSDTESTPDRRIRAILALHAVELADVLRVQFLAVHAAVGQDNAAEVMQTAEDAVRAVRAQHAAIVALTLCQ